MQKRGLSEVVTSLIVILLVLIAIGIVWVIVSKIIANTSDKIGLEGLTIDMKITGATYDSETSPQSLNINVKRNPGEGDLIGLVFIFEGNGKSGEYKTIQTINQLEEKQITIPVASLTAIPITDISKISIAPIFKSESEKEKIGNVVDEVELNCIDDTNDDNGNSHNRLIKGTTKTNFGDYADSCLNPNGVYDYSCSGKVVTKTFITCLMPLPQLACNDGKCI